MLYAIDKPHGITSFGAINKLKYFLKNCQDDPSKKIKIGHSGTLDPFATGLMLVGVGPDTKKLAGLTGLDKTYTATIDFSKDSDTRDLQYWDWIKDIDCTDAPKRRGVSIEKIKEKLATLIPSSQLPIPVFSAKKKDGKRSYHLARQGKAVEEMKEMKIHSCKIIKYEFPLLEIEVDVGSGTYIRSIAHRLGEQFGLGGILTALRRTKVGNYELKDYTFKDIPDTDVLYCELP